MVSQTRPRPLFFILAAFLLLHKRSKEHVIDAAKVQKAVVQFFFTLFDSNALVCIVQCVDLCNFAPFL